MVYGVLQGSVLGAIFFLLYCGDLQLIIKSHELHPHQYADGSLIYIRVPVVHQNTRS